VELSRSVAHWPATASVPSVANIQAAVWNQSRIYRQQFRTRAVALSVCIVLHWSQEPAFRNSTALRMASSSTYPDINAFTDDGSSRGRGSVQHCNASRSDASTFSILHAKCTRTQWHNHLTMHCQSASCPELGLATASSSLHGRGQALSTDRVLRATTTGKYHHLICSWATLLSACRPADPASTRHLR
jgi:hypothetical protein